ncbi:hypothetical protein [Nannocystis pusilla]|uniref:Lipoprotein n=1 Tax=Nannocystis pusilla TaxID=889268 RepID=A0ABS7TTP5_9BACT|nr:hypothetical protein [Nannocystis pusilla]MBZ5711590.1 hypothetical protein [Nannocystis pusilla]
MRSAMPLALAALLLGCAHKSVGGPVSVRSESVKEDDAELFLDLTYEPRGPRQVELVLKMRVGGIVETNKLVAEVYIQGFNVEGSGATRWDGFVPPRTPQTFRVLLTVADGFDEASATVMLSRSQDSNQLLREELTFAVDAEGRVHKQ